ncbi:MAG: 16S rRNA (guanine(527)-N(7))-methyltransferase RsmG [Rhodospirillaceae bacterium]
MKQPGPEAFAQDFDVSRETLERLRNYADLLVKWNARINLVSPDSIPNLWLRHVADSAQLFRYIPQNALNLLDVGSGAGFPGLVLAILGVSNVHLVESDQRKVAFLREAARVTGVTVTLWDRRIEQVPPFTAGVITARALAGLDKLLAWTEPFRGPETLCMFLKGQTVEAELTEAYKQWTMRIDRQKSLTDPTGTILALREVCRVRDANVRDDSRTPAGERK